uniref:GH3 middle domain-containing protein n=1 Tax=Oryza glumipatula TaxID=40148 RepID=A0A0D9Y5B5_9ORYZ
MLEKKATRSTRVDGVSGEAVIEEFERVTRDAANVQRETLRRILAENGGVEYLRGLGLAGATDPATFRARVPLATHADLEPYIDRIADGDASPVLTAKPATSISLRSVSPPAAACCSLTSIENVADHGGDHLTAGACSSGTTQGKRKYLLFNEELVKSTMQIYRISYAFRNREFPVENGKALQFIYSSRETRTKGGLTATTATTNVYRSEEFKATMRDIQSQCCSPDEVIFGPDFAQSLYCHLLAGLLAAGDVQIVSATFAHSVVLAFQTFERAWEDLCADIRRGEVSPSRVTSPAVRRAMAALLAAPNPGLADEVARKCAALSNWYGVIPALWPNARYVYGIMTGSMEHYVKKLRHYAGGLPLVAAEYGASEGWVGANVEPGTPPERATFTVLPDIAYFEFIPLKPVAGDGGYAEAEPVGLTEVAAGELYEVVMTTFADQ